ncbi:Ig-like domain-containing protein [Alteromonas sp. 14N.309.X.WAT.G.H12]|uniref:Ig-like domain-containing protein n=1 Tax=Alteromonas sp. 14N.309.X.WAT.G.H12 TaxID=3120824 RepID=UPI002FD43F28
MKTLSKSLTLFSMLFLLFACGGGDSLERDSDSSTDSDDTSDETYTVSLSLVNQNYETDRNLATDNPLTVVVTVTDEEGSALADTLVTFTLSNDELADFSNDTGTARTDDSGQATIGLTVGTAAGDGQITATLPDGTTGTTTFTSAGSDVALDPEYTVTFSLVNDSDVEDRDLASDNPLTLSLEVVDQYGNPLTDSLISFSLSDDDLANFSTDTAAARTDENGEASIGLTVGSAAGDGEITAILPDGTTATTTFTSAGSDVALDPEYSVTFSIVNTSGEEDRDLASDNPLIVNLTVVDQNDNPLTDALISFALSNDNLAVFTSDTASARTDENGEASIGLTVGSAAGDGEITATLPDGTTATTTFTSAGSMLPWILNIRLLSLWLTTVVLRTEIWHQIIPLR